jgi:hypothetical protein
VNVDDDRNDGDIGEDDDGDCYGDNDESNNFARFARMN